MKQLHKIPSVKFRIIAATIREEQANHQLSCLITPQARDTKATEIDCTAMSNVWATTNANDTKSAKQSEMRRMANAGPLAMYACSRE